VGGGACSNLAEQLRDKSLPSGWKTLRHLLSFSLNMLGEGDAKEGDAGGLDP